MTRLVTIPRFAAALFVAGLALDGRLPPRVAADDPPAELVVPPLARDDSPAPPADPAPTPATTVPVVGPVEVQCGAARSSSLGNSLDAQRRAVRGPRHALHAREAREAHVRRLVLGLAAEEARNRDAGSALECYWSLSEAEHSLPAIDAAAAEAEAALADLAKLAGRGLELPVGDAPLRGRQIMLEEARITTTAALDSLTLALSQLAGLPQGPMSTVHPSTGRAVVEEPLDVEALVAEGLARRPELRMLRVMLAHLDADTVDVGRLVLGLANPALGGGGSSTCKACPRISQLLHHRQRSAETAAVAGQLRQLLRDRQRAVEAEIRMATRLTEAAAAKVVTAEQQQAVSEQAAADSRSRQGVADVDAFAVRVADLDAIAARRTVVERLAAWERARAKLWQAQGVLAAACRGTCR